MEELYKSIEEKIKASGYPRVISGEAVYGDICDQIEGKENGSYVLLSKFEDDVIFAYFSAFAFADKLLLSARYSSIYLLTRCRMLFSSLRAPVQKALLPARDHNSLNR